MGLPGLNGVDLPPKSIFSLVCPNCGRKFSIISLGKNGKRVSLNCPHCNYRMGVALINKLIAAIKAKKKAKAKA
jgi:DNA-directed RNA polymerase subunit RPC12/RpoP